MIGQTLSTSQNFEYFVIMQYIFMSFVNYEKIQMKSFALIELKPITKKASSHRGYSKFN